MRENRERAPIPGDLTGLNGGDLGGLLPEISALSNPKITSGDESIFGRGNG